MTRKLMPRAPLAGFVLAIALACGLLCSGWSLAQQRFASGPEGLKRLGETLQRAIASGDVTAAAALTRSLLLDESQIAKALNTRTPRDVVEKIAALHKGAPTDDQQLAGFFRIQPNQSVVTAHMATTEDLAKNQQGSAAERHFPGGALKLAAAGVLRPGMTFYEMSFVEPGKQAGMKLHLFYWDGQGWKMLGPAWRAMDK